MCTVDLTNLFIKPEPNMSLICSNFTNYHFQHFPRNLPIFLILFPYHYLLFPYYSLCFTVQVLISKETRTWYIFCFSYIIVYMIVMYIPTSKMANESHTCLLKLPDWFLMSLFATDLIFNSYQLILNYDCEHPIILNLCLVLPCIPRTMLKMVTNNTQN